jgi:hypothetical protein
MEANTRRFPSKGLRLCITTASTQQGSKFALVRLISAAAMKLHLQSILSANTAQEFHVRWLFNTIMSPFFQVYRTRS